MAPVAPYAFTSTPSLTSYRQQAPLLRQDQRTISAPAVPASQSGLGPRSRYPAPASVSTTSSSSSSEASAAASKDSVAESVGLQAQTWEASRVRPQSTIITSSTTSVNSVTAAPTPKPAPDRYRRGARRTNSGPESIPTSATIVSMASATAVYNLQAEMNQAFGSPSQTPLFQAPQVLQQKFNGENTILGNSGARTAVDDMFIQKRANLNDNARTRRRSIHDIDVGQIIRKDTQVKVSGPQGYQQVVSLQHPLRSSPVARPASSPERDNYEKMMSARSNQQRPSSVSLPIFGSSSLHAFAWDGDYPYQ
jgi:hypothetical protein